MTPFVQSANAWLRRVPVWPVYAAGAALPLWLFWQGASGALGADPVKTMERTLGLWALRLLVLGLAVTPLRRLTGISLLRFRRAIGLTAFGLALCHFLTWLALDMGFLWGQIVADIVKRPYVTMGMAGLVLMLPLAATSNDWSLRRFGAGRWRRLHRLTYPAVLAGAVHYLWLVKAWPVSPILYLAAVGVLLALRFGWWRPRRGANGAIAR